MSKGLSNADASMASEEIFVLGFKALTEDARRHVVAALIRDDELMEDMEAALLWEQRKDEPSRPLREYLAEREAREA